MKHLIRYSIILVLFVCLVSSLFSQSITHTVQKDETLYSLGKKYGVSVKDIRFINKMGSSNNLYIGQQLIIRADDDIAVPASGTGLTSSLSEYEAYTVEPGDTLYSISQKAGLTVNELLILNGISESSVLRIGQNLQIPASTIKTAPLPTLAFKEDPREISTNIGDTSLIWPVKASEVSYVTGKISGVALTGTKNEQVTAIRSGTVIFSGIYRGFGQVIFVQATTGHIYVYTGLDSLSVSKGQYITYGENLGRIGNDTLSGKHLMNLMVFKGGNPIDPAKAPRG